MSTYAIGDVQGCLDALLILLKHIDFDPQCDTLWFTGDLASRGKQPVETLRYIKQLNSICVLGNHDLTLLAALKGDIPLAPDEPARAILDVPDREALAHWLQGLPLLHYDRDVDVVMTHAGIYPRWDIQQAIRYAKEAEDAIRGNDFPALCHNMYGNLPDAWDEGLEGWDRIRFILNAFTRMRFLTPEGALDLHSKGHPQQHPDQIPWFAFPAFHMPPHTRLLFGHWAALSGDCHIPHLYALDTGCIWGGTLTALCLETKQRFTVAC